MRGAQAGQLLTLPGIALAVLLGQAGLNVPVVIGGVLFLLLAVFLAVFMPEAGFRPAPREERTSWGRMFATLREGVGLVRLRPLLLVILLVSLVYGVYSEGFDRLYTPHLLSFGLPEVGGLDMAVWFGLIGAVVSVLSLGATGIVRPGKPAGWPGCLTRAGLAVWRRGLASRGLRPGGQLRAGGGRLLGDAGAARDVRAAV